MPRPFSFPVLGAMSKALATIATQPLIVAKVGLQSKPPPSRQGKPFKGFVEVMQFIIKNEGPMGLFKGIAPQILKGFMVQGILMMTKERYVFFGGGEGTPFLLLFPAYQYSQPLLTTTWQFLLQNGAAFHPPLPLRAPTTRQAAR